MVVFPLSGQPRASLSAPLVTRKLWSDIMAMIAQELDGVAQVSQGVARSRNRP